MNVLSASALHSGQRHPVLPVLLLLLHRHRHRHRRCFGRGWAVSLSGGAGGAGGAGGGHRAPTHGPGPGPGLRVRVSGRGVPAAGLCSNTNRDNSLKKEARVSVEDKPSKSQQLKKVFKEYGAVAVVFHIGISLASLGIFYVGVSSGVNVADILYKVGFSEAVIQSRMAAGTSTFVLAYAAHKLFAPVRVSITLVSVPFIVRYLRKIGLFKGASHSKP
eukprot:gi/632939493/ref/XP_007910267.1/ PREDICTED: protein FAM210B [Callorhinchus milii]